MSVMCETLNLILFTAFNPADNLLQSRMQDNAMRPYETKTGGNMCLWGLRC